MTSESQQALDAALQVWTQRTSDLIEDTPEGHVRALLAAVEPIIRAGLEPIIRQDERARWSAEFQRAAEWHRADARAHPFRKGSNPAIGFELAAEQIREALL